MAFLSPTPSLTRSTYRRYHASQLCRHRPALAERRSHRTRYIATFSSCMATTSVETQASDTVDEAPKSPGFNELVSGEWFGYECIFSAIDGKAQCIEERYVPDDFRQWGVEIKGFEIVHSATVVDGTLRLKRVRALPSVGCEADAVATEERVTETAGVVGFDSGSFALETSDGLWILCIAHPHNNRERVRVEIPKMARQRRAGPVSVTLERWDAPYCDAALLPGCGGAAVSFADEEALDPQELWGKWEVRSVSMEKHEMQWRRVENVSVIRRSIEDAVNAVPIAMPHGISLSFTSDSVEAAWLADKGVRASMCRECGEDGTLRRVVWSVERVVKED